MQKSDTFWSQASGIRDPQPALGCSEFPSFHSVSVVPSPVRFNWGSSVRGGARGRCFQWQPRRGQKAVKGQCLSHPDRTGSGLNALSKTSAFSGLQFWVSDSHFPRGQQWVCRKSTQKKPALHLVS